MNTTQLNILLVEDSIEDADLINMALEESALQPELSTVTDGQKALDYLYKKGDYSGAPTPDLIILDLNLPKRSGHEILADIKTNPRLRIIPVVILSTSRSTNDILKSYDNYANCYVCKPLRYEQFRDVLKEIEHFWLNVVQLPGTN